MPNTKPLAMTVLFAACAISCSNPGGTTSNLQPSTSPNYFLLPSPTITAAQTQAAIWEKRINVDLKKSAVAGIPWIQDREHQIAWRFQDSPSFKIKVLDTKRESNGDMYITASINAATSLSPALNSWKRMMGKIKLYYLNVPDGWRLSTVSNVDSTFSVYDSTNRELKPDLGKFRPFTVRDGQIEWVDISLRSAALLNALITVTGGSNDVFVYVVDSNNQVVGQRHSTQQFGGAPMLFEAELKPGAYRLVFDNSHSKFKDKTVQVELKAKYR